MIKNLKSLKTYLPLILLVVIVITLIVAGIRRQETQENFLGGRFKNSFNSGVSRNSGYRRASSNHGALRRSNKRWNNRYTRQYNRDAVKNKIQMHNNYMRERENQRNSITKLNQLPKSKVFGYFMAPDWKRTQDKNNDWFLNMSDELQNNEKWNTITQREFTNKTTGCDRNKKIFDIVRNKPGHTDWDVDGNYHLKRTNEWIYCQFHPEECEGPGECRNQKKQ